MGNIFLEMKSYADKIRRSLLREQKSLDKELNSILIGLILGDAHVYRSSPKANSRIEISLGGKYKEFAYSLEKLFSFYMLNPLKLVTIKGQNKDYISFKLKTMSLPVFNQYHEMFYKFDSDLLKYVKIIPENIESLMDPIVLSYLIMSDGNFDKGRNRIRIFTNSFTEKEVRFLAEAIKIKFGIYVGVLHDRKDQWILTIGAKQLDLLRNIVKEHFNPSMLYRIGFSS
jgi:hypothetical protein